MTKEEFMAKLQMVYVGDRNAFNEIITVYDNLQQRIDLAKKLLKEYIGVLDDVADSYFENVLSILQGEEVK